MIFLAILEVMDSVTCFDVLEHIPDKGTTLSEIYRVLQPGGWWFLVTLNKTFRSRLLIIWCGEVFFRLVPRGTHDWRYFVGRESLRRLMEASGFTETRFAGIRPDRRRRNKGRLPVRISPEGNTSICYFGAAVKPVSQGKEA